MSESEPKLVVACIGASATAAKGSFNWWQELQSRPRNSGFELRAFAAGGDLSYNGLERLPVVVEAKPTAVITLLGLNDVMALEVPIFRRFAMRTKHLPQEPSPAWFRENMEALVSGLKQQTNARIGLCSPLSVGENPEAVSGLQGAINRRLHEYGSIVHDIASRYGVTYVPVYERFEERFRDRPGKSFDAFRFRSFYANVVRQYVFRMSLDSIARRAGWRLHVDGIHLNTEGGQLLTEIMQEFLDGVFRDAGPALRP